MTKCIYLVSDRFPAREQFGLTSQIRRAAVSVPSNIAEGQARQHTGEFAQFLFVALGSLAEIDTQLTLAKELAFVDQQDIEPLHQQISEIRRMLHALVKHLPQRARTRQA